MADEGIGPCKKSKVTQGLISTESVLFFELSFPKNLGTKLV